jgi:capsular polysaccharide biosynthesis protein
VEKELKITNQSTIIILEKRKEGRKLKQMLIINIIKFFICVFFNLFIFIKIYFLNKFLLFTIKEFEKISNTFEGI